MHSFFIIWVGLLAMAIGITASPNGAGPHPGHGGTSCTESGATLTQPFSSNTVDGNIPIDSVTSSTTLTSTITSTTTVTITITDSSSSCDLTDATTGIPITASPTLSYANTTVALNTTTSTVHLTNVTSNNIAAPTANVTAPNATVSPIISGFKGAATHISSHSAAAVLGFVVMLLMTTL
ncbi:hypothetical protein B0A52_01624 [Exophiala mesophila]|uniref:Uncharacterized protein n=1 Tax=Exophiala mesophila TaxID=212818 RepID=A0A438NFJ0_EXOME|nr:hypothetical protein B0A52_01624 [Exophiala mesophila]